MECLEGDICQNLWHLDFLLEAIHSSQHTYFAKIVITGCDASVSVCDGRATINAGKLEGTDDKMDHCVMVLNKSLSW